jgi:DNA-binding NarL/FixJ family response regulator
MNGLETAPILRKKLPTVILILSSNYASDAMEGLAREAGIHAVVPKYQASTHLMPTVHALFSGQPSPRRTSRYCLSSWTVSGILHKPICIWPQVVRIDSAGE